MLALTTCEGVPIAPREDGTPTAPRPVMIRKLALLALPALLVACAPGYGPSSGPAPGDDWVGLSRAFLSAGAKSVIASLWAVQDRATATLMQRFYERYGGAADPGRTLAEAQRAMLTVPGTAHPYYWAGFEVIGGK